MPDRRDVHDDLRARAAWARSPVHAVTTVTGHGGGTRTTAGTRRRDVARATSGPPPRRLRRGGPVQPGADATRRRSGRARRPAARRSPRPARRRRRRSPARAARCVVTRDPAVRLRDQRVPALEQAAPRRTAPRPRRACSSCRASTSSRSTPSIRASSPACGVSTAALRRAGTWASPSASTTTGTPSSQRRGQLRRRPRHRRRSRPPTPAPDPSAATTSGCGQPDRSATASRPTYRTIPTRPLRGTGDAQQRRRRGRAPSRRARPTTPRVYLWASGCGTGTSAATSSGCRRLDGGGRQLEPDVDERAPRRTPGRRPHEVGDLVGAEGDGDVGDHVRPVEPAGVHRDPRRHVDGDDRDARPARPAPRPPRAAARADRRCPTIPSTSDVGTRGLARRRPRRPPAAVNAASPPAWARRGQQHRLDPRSRGGPAARRRTARHRRCPRRRPAAAPGGRSAAEQVDDRGASPAAARSIRVPSGSRAISAFSAARTCSTVWAGACPHASRLAGAGPASVSSRGCGSPGRGRSGPAVDAVEAGELVAGHAVAGADVAEGVAGADRVGLVRRLGGGLRDQLGRRAPRQSRRPGEARAATAPRSAFLTESRKPMASP